MLGRFLIFVIGEIVTGSGGFIPVLRHGERQWQFGFKPTTANWLATRITLRSLRTMMPQS